MELNYIFACAQERILRELDNYSLLSSQLIEQMGFSRSHARHTLKKLEKKGLIEHCGFHFHHSDNNDNIYPVKLYRIKDALERECIV